MWVWVSTALLATVLMLGLLWILVNLRKKAGGTAAQPNHRALFFMGVVMLIAGTAEVLIFLRTALDSADRYGPCQRHPWPGRSPGVT
jgi:hypothetical protein